MKPIVEKVEALRAESEETAARTDSGSRVLAEERTSSGRANVFRREGEFWTITYEGRSVRLRSTRGLRYLEALLLHPGRDFHVADLVAMVGGENPAHVEGSAAESGHDRAGVAARSGLGDAGDVLDTKAKGEYRTRLEDLRGELEEATKWADSERAARAQTEIDFITRELAAAYGLGGRSRKAAATAERLRKAVASRLDHAIARIQKEHPSLGLHLTNAVRSGSFCSYVPDRQTPWTS
jgi:hypothetical protein